MLSRVAQVVENHGAQNSGYRYPLLDENLRNPVLAETASQGFLCYVMSFGRVPGRSDAS